MRTRAEIQKKWISSPKGVAYRNSDEFRDSVKRNRNGRDREHRKKTLEKVRKIKMEKGCLKCGYNKHHAALQFHHRDPETKKFRLGDARGYSLKACLEEIAKCDVLCSNCHAVLEYEKRPISGSSNGRKLGR